MLGPFTATRLRKMFLPRMPSGRALLTTEACGCKGEATAKKLEKSPNPQGSVVDEAASRPGDSAAQTAGRRGGGSANSARAESLPPTGLH